MKRWMAAVLAAFMLIGLIGLAEPEEDFDFDFDDGGYTGEWVALKGLDLQFCLPDGWTALESDLSLAFQGISDDSRVTLEVGEIARDVDDLPTWADANLSGHETDEAGLYFAVTQESDEQVTVYILDADRVIAFRFDRAAVDAISRDFALQIAGSTSEDWGDEGESIDELDDANAVLAGDSSDDAGW